MGCDDTVVAAALPSEHITQVRGLARALRPYEYSGNEDGDKDTSSFPSLYNWKLDAVGTSLCTAEQYKSHSGG